MRVSKISVDSDEAGIHHCVSSLVISKCIIHCKDTSFQESPLIPYLRIFFRIVATMKTSINISLLCFLLSLQNASAFMGFSFGNLLFALHACDNIGHGPFGCKLDCSKHFPPGPKHVCKSDCYVESDATCSSLKGVDMSNYFRCMAESTDSCTTSTDSDSSSTSTTSATSYSSYASDSSSSTTSSDGSVSSYVGDTSTSNGGSQPVASRVSLLPFFAAATISTMFLILYVWRKNVSFCDFGKKIPMVFIESEASH